MKPTRIALLKMILATAVFVTAVLFVGFQVSQNQKLAETTRLKQESMLRIAVVNEDRGSRFEGKSYEVGQSYVNRLSQDKVNQWTLASRSVAEEGLDKGDFQLVIYIPSNFSQKILDIDSVAPKQATVTYKVNSNGNTTVENLANQVGNQIVEDLDQQLVDVYMASILANLYQAQQNVQRVVSTQGTNISVYQRSILGAATGFRSGLPNLRASAQDSLESNSQLLADLLSTNLPFDDLTSGQTSFTASLKGLIAKRQAGDLSYNEFIDQLLALDNLDIQTQALYQQLQTDQADLSAYFTRFNPTTSAPEDGQLKQSLSKLKQTEAELTSQINGSAASVMTELADFYGIDTQGKSAEEIEASLDGLTLRQFLNRYDAANSWEKDLEAAKAAYEARKAELSSQVHTGSITIDNSAGTFDTVNVTADSVAANVAVTGVSVNGQSGGSSFNLNKGANTVSYSYRVTGPSELPYPDSADPDMIITVSQVGAIVSGAKAKPTNQSASAAHGSPLVANLTSPTSPTAAQGSMSSGLKPSSSSSSATIPSSSEAGSASSSSAVAPPAGDTQSGSSDPSASPTAQSLTFRVKADYSGYASQDYQDLQANYHQLQGQVALLDEPLVQGLKSRIKNALSEPLGTVSKLSDQLKTAEDQVNQVDQRAKAVTSDIANLTQDYQSLRDQLQALQQASEADKLKQSDITKSLADLDADFADLISAAQRAREKSASNIAAAERVQERLQRFNSEVDKAESTAGNLAADASDLSAAFNQELDRNQDFVGSFVKVLNNAYANGVPNEELIKFLANPVKHEAQATRATTNVYKPFIWILLLAAVAIFMAYLLSSNQIFQTRLDKFTKAETVFLRGNAKTIIVGQLLTFLTSLLIGTVSFGQLQLSATYGVLWVFSIIAMTMFLVQWLYLGLRYLKAAGMGLTLFFLISYIYLTSAVGPTAHFDGLASVIRTVNIFTIFESLLSGFFVNSPIALWQIFLIMLGLVLGIIVGIFAEPKKSGNKTDG